MSRRTDPVPSPTRWLALDIGGANLKAAHCDGPTTTEPFEVWRRPAELGKAIATLAAAFPPFDRAAVTMTAELCDCYPTKAEGVLAILEAAAQAVGGRRLSVWGIDGRFHELAEIRRRPVLAAAANWLALATAAARLVSDDRGLMIDIGSTTTDIIPLDRGRVAVRGRTDTERLRTGELVYAGIRRTPLCALTTELPLGQGPPIGLAAELFATSLDVFLTLGDLDPDPTDLATADGRGATVDAARDRLARMVGADREGFSADDALELSRSAAECLLRRLSQAAHRVCQATMGIPDVVVVAGSGEFLARRLAARVLGSDCPIISLAEAWGSAASTAGCARALLMLAVEHKNPLCSMPTYKETTVSPNLATSPSGLVVIKVGGSLLDWPELPGRLAAFLDNRRGRAARLREQAVLIAGGGPFADLIRTMDHTHDLGDQIAHRLAIRSLDVTAELLAGLLPGSAVVHRPEDLRTCRDSGQVPILAPGRFLEELDDRGPDPLPASWDVTSDSIAARIAGLLGARHLILLKSAGLSAEIDRGQAARLGLVDAMFPRIAAALEVVELVCLRDREPLARVLTVENA